MKHATTTTVHQGSEKFRHTLLVRRDPAEVARFRELVHNKQGIVGVIDVTVDHHDDNCCEREPWPVTFIHLMFGEDTP